MYFAVEREKKKKKKKKKKKLRHTEVLPPSHFCKKSPGTKFINLKNKYAYPFAIKTRGSPEPVLFI